MHDSCAFFILHIVVNKHGEGPALFILERKGCKALDQTQGECLELTVDNVNGKDKMQIRKTMRKWRWKSLGKAWQDRLVDLVSFRLSKRLYLSN